MRIVLLPEVLPTPGFSELIPKVGVELRFFLIKRWSRMIGSA